jgi:hypothetical protein
MIKGILILTLLCFGINVLAQPKYKEYVCFSPGNTTIKSIENTFNETLPLRSFAFSGIWAGEKNYFIGDASLPAQYLFSLIYEKYNEDIYGNDATWSMWAYGTDIFSKSNYRIGLGGTMDVRPFLVKYLGKDVHLNILGLYLNTLYMQEFGDNMINTFVAHVGPVFNKRQSSPVDGWAYIFRNSFSYNFIEIGKGRKMGVSIIPELRFYRTKQKDETLWKANSKLLSFGLSIMY